MSSRQSFVKKDGLPRRRRQLVIKERNISADEFMAASIGDVEWLDQSLRNSGPTPNHSNFDRNGLAPIHLAALHGRIKCLELLVEKYDADVNLPSATGWTPLHLCINKETGSGAMKCMNYLLEKGAEIDSINDDNVTPIHQAASEGLLDCLKILIEKNADLNIPDVRGHRPEDLARLWAHKACTRIIRNEMWRREKQERAEELKQLHIVKQYYTELQQEAVHQLRNEQEFYGGVAFGNWLADKGLPENLKQMTTFQRERYPEVSTTEGLSKRLRTSGGLDDCAQRMERTTIQQQSKQQKSTNLPKQPTTSFTEKPNSKQTSKSRPDKQTPVKTTKVSEKGTQERVIKKVVKVERPVQERKPESYTPQQREVWDSSKTFTPYSEMTGPSEVPTRKTPWNFSTNLNSDPITNIKCKDTVALSIHPEETGLVFPKHANLSVKLESALRPKIKVTLPGGRIKSADIRMPDLPSSLVSDELSGISSDRIRIPQEFKAVHVYDIQKKKQPSTRPKDEVGMHLSVLGDPRLLRKSVSSSVYSSKSPLSTLSPNLCGNLPAIDSNGFSRTLGTLDRWNPPKAFLA